MIYIIREQLANRLEYFRKLKGLTIYQVGELVGKSGKTISAWEKGRGQPDADMLLKLCETYSIDSIADLYGNSPNADKKNKPTAECGELTEEEQTLVHNYRELNEEGRQKLLETSDDLVATGKYTKNNPAQVPKQA